MEKNEKMKIMKMSNDNDEYEPVAGNEPKSSLFGDNTGIMRRMQTPSELLEQLLGGEMSSCLGVCWVQSESFEWWIERRLAR